MKYLLCFCLFIGLNANETLWKGQLVSLVEEDGFPAIALNRDASIEELSDEEKIDLERTVGKMQAVFERVFGFGDFTRWMPLGEEKLVSYLFPAGAYSGSDEIDFDLKIRVMLFTLKSRKEILAPLANEKIRAIQAAAAEILPHPQPDIAPEDRALVCTKILKGLSLALRELGQSSELQEEPPPFNFTFTTRCNVFCNSKILQKQQIFDSEFNHLLANHRPYVACHLMIVPARHITTLSESSNAEILDKFALISKINDIAGRWHPKVGIATRIGWRAGQTQSHLHDHIIGFDPQGDQPWISNWLHELMSNQNPVDSVQLEINRTYWKKFFDSPEHKKL